MAEKKLTSNQQTNKTTSSKTAATRNTSKKTATLAKEQEIPKVEAVASGDDTQEKIPHNPTDEKMNNAFGVSRAGKNAPTNSGEIFAELSRQIIAERRAKRRWGIFFKLITLTIILFIVVQVFSTDTGEFPIAGDIIDSQYDDPFVAVVTVKGLIADSADVAASSVIENLRSAMEYENSKAIILDINSPGGSPVQAASIYRELVRLREVYPDKPIYAVISDLGASGAYYIAAGANYIYADPSSIVGSIGVILSGFGFTGSMEKLGIERRLLTSGVNKAMLDPFQARDYIEESYMQNLLDNVHRQFIDDVIKSRPQLADQDQSVIFSGLIFDGRTALELGLIDGLGDTYSVSRDEIGVEKLFVIDSNSDEWLSLIRKFASSFASELKSALSSAGEIQLR